MHNDMTEEQAIEQQFGRQNPFAVPDGYFEQFTSQMMSRLEAEKPRAQVRRFFLRRYAVAASITAVIVGGAVWFVQPRHNVAVGHLADKAHVAASVAANTASSDYNIDQMADYAMLDGQDFYSYLADY